MQIHINRFDSNTIADCIILPIYQDKQQPLITTEFNKTHNNIIDKLISSHDITGKFGELRWLYNASENTKRILTVGAGKPDTLTNSSYISLINLTIQQLTDKPLNHVINGLADIDFNKKYKNLNQPEKQSLNWKLNQIALITENYLNPAKKYQATAQSKLTIETYSISSCAELPSDSDLNTLLNHNHALAKAIKTAKDLGNMPPNICTPGFIADEANNLAKKHPNLACTIYSHEQLEEMGMGSFCSVSQGSDNPGKLIVLEYNGCTNKNEQPYVLIGKGITFDTGGYTLKPPKSMLGMKYDMCGAASVLATMQAVSDLKLPLNIVGILACAENMIGHKSTRPNDIVTTYSGKTVEINNTDAEGRLVLCDAISYSEKFKPKVIIDVATLTGATVVALGYHYSAAYTNKAELEQELLQVANLTHDPIWFMPLCHDYDELMRSPIADLHNSSSMPVAGSITAACFLANFVPENCAWVHLDIAGTATVKGDHTEATGRPVSLLVNYLLNQI